MEIAVFAIQQQHVLAVLVFEREKRALIVLWVIVAGINLVEYVLWLVAQQAKDPLSAQISRA